MHTFEDPNYPHYGALPSGTIGEVGFDALRPPAVEPGNTPPGTVPPPTNADIMNYGAPRWISPYTYSNLFRAVGGQKSHDPCRATLPPQEWFFPEIHRQFICHYVAGLPGGDLIEKMCGPKIKIQFPPMLKLDGAATSVRATLLDDQGASLFTETFEATPLFEDVADIASSPALHNGPRRYEFAISVPELDGAQRLIVEHGGKVIDDITLSAKPVAFEARASVLDGSIPMVRVEWSLSPGEARVPVFVRASSDNGHSWTAFNVPPGATRLDLDPASLPPGEGCVVEVLAGTQLRTGSWRSERMPVATGREELLVLRPRGSTTVPHGEALVLSAVSTYGSCYGESIWSSDRDGDLGTGGYQLVRLSRGKHLLTVRRGPCGERVTAAMVEVVDR
jgi:hypothetical protein